MYNPPGALYLLKRRIANPENRGFQMKTAQKNAIKKKMDIKSTIVRRIFIP